MKQQMKFYTGRLCDLSQFELSPEFFVLNLLQLCLFHWSINDSFNSKSLQVMSFAEAPVVPGHICALGTAAPMGGLLADCYFPQHPPSSSHPQSTSASNSGSYLFVFSYKSSLSLTLTLTLWLDAALKKLAQTSMPSALPWEADTKRWQLYKVCQPMLDSTESHLKKPLYWQYVHIVKNYHFENILNKVALFSDVLHTSIVVITVYTHQFTIIIIYNYCVTFKRVKQFL